MSHDLPSSHCKFCGEKAEDCTCSRENDRLLSEQEMMDATGLRCNCEECLDSNKWAIATTQDAKSIAARDKWWRGLLQEVNEANDLKDLQERFAHLLRYTADLEVKQ